MHLSSNGLNAVVIGVALDTRASKADKRAMKTVGAERQGGPRRRLIDVAIERFGEVGPDATGTRDLARRAGTQMSSIRYYFGSKEGLYLAAAQHIADEIGFQLPALLQPAMIPGDEPRDPAVARVLLRDMLIGMLHVIVTPESAPYARFIAREQAHPGAAFDILYRAVMNPLLTLVAERMEFLSCGRVGPSEARLRAVALFGQILVFRTANETVLRSTGWGTIDDGALKSIIPVVSDQIDAVLSRLSADGRL